MIYTTHLVFPLTWSSVQCEYFAIKAGCHLEGLDELRCAQTAGTLCDDARKTHLVL